MFPDERLIEPFMFKVFAPTVKVPEFKFSNPLIIGELLRVKLPLVVKLLKAVALPANVPVPEKATVPVCALKVPLFVKAPPLAIVIVLFPALITDVVAIVNSEMLGEVSKLTVTPEGIETETELEFGIPPHQLLISFQLPLEPPIHVPFEFNVIATLVLVVLSHPETV